MSKRNKTLKNSRHTHIPKGKKHPENKQMLDPDLPATEKQKELLRMTVDKKWLVPNPFIQHYSKWENLTAGEADKLLASISPERIGALEKELDEKNKHPGRDHSIARSIGRGIEDEIKQFGHVIDGGL